jgi:hypothetical protein
MAFNDKCVKFDMKQNKFFKKKNPQKNETQKLLLAFKDYYDQQSPEKRKSRFSILYGNRKIIFNLLRQHN